MTITIITIIFSLDGSSTEAFFTEKITFKHVNLYCITHKVFKAYKYIQASLCTKTVVSIFKILSSFLFSSDEKYLFCM